MNVVCIPTYNEKESITKIISRVRQHAGDIRILVIDDNSPDGTGSVVKDLMRSDSNLSILERPKKEGLGVAYIDAFNKIISGSEPVENVIIMDADGSHDPKNIPVMLEKVKDSDVVIGSRYIDGGSVVGWPWHRKLLSKFANTYCRFLLGVPIYDMTAGFVCFRREVLDKVDFNKFHALGYAFQVESKYRTFKAGCSFIETPIIFEDREKGDSKMDPTIILESAISPLRLLFKRD